MSFNAFINVGLISKTMNHKKLLSQVFFLAFLLFSLDGCFLFPDSSSKETLPPATQTGANTFGCYVNGKLWLPKGYDGTSNYIVSYDPTLDGGTLNITTYRYYGSGQKDEQNMTIYLDSLAMEGNYELYTPKYGAAIFSDWNKCTYQDISSFNYKIGNVTITKLDLQKSIISGTFQFVICQPNCDTIKVTQGRFDKKL
jgi:hypothetical protein